MAHQTYMALNDKYLKEGERLLAQGDYPQASEKFWGATAELVKGVAITRGWSHGTHRALWECIQRLQAETGDVEVRELFGAANSLHINFYQDHLSPEEVARYAEDARRLIEKLQRLV